MICKFCSVKEAAERLDATEDQIETLLQKGMLREFRDGPHRLLRTADIGALVVARNRRLERRGQPRRPGADRSSSSSSTRQGRSAVHQESARPGITGRSRKRIADHGGPVRRPGSVNSPRRPSLSDRPRGKTSPADPEVCTPYQTLSLREWFWTGLIQDNPVAIVILCSFILSVLGAVIAGAYLLTDIL